MNFTQLKQGSVATYLGLYADAINGQNVTHVESK